MQKIRKVWERRHLQRHLKLAACAIGTVIAMLVGNLQAPHGRGEGRSLRQQTQRDDVLLHR